VAISSRTSDRESLHTPNTGAIKALGNSFLTLVAVHLRSKNKKRSNIIEQKGKLKSNVSRGVTRGGTFVPNFTCHETGHIAADCPRRANKATGSISQIATTLEPKPQKHVMISTLEKQAAEVLDSESDDSDQVYSYNWKKKLEKKGT
jgi:hypothetical protein